MFVLLAFLPIFPLRRGGGATPYYGLYGEAPPERGPIFMLQVYKRVGILQVEVYEREICHVVILRGFQFKQFEQTHITAASFHLLDST